MERIIGSISALKNGPVGARIQGRMGGFRAAGAGSAEDLFSELCFCILTANYSAEGGMRIQKEIGDGFIALDLDALSRRLKALGYRFPNARAGYIASNRAHIPFLKDAISLEKAPFERREWLVENIMGFGYKEASHFLRNIGQSDFAIVDFHIVDLLVRHGMIRKPKTRSLNRKAYLEVEAKLGEIAKRAGLSQGELDLYLWYMETGKILK